jgi:hypothetical protein
MKLSPLALVRYSLVTATAIGLVSLATGCSADAQQTVGSTEEGLSTCGTPTCDVGGGDDPPPDCPHVYESSLSAYGCSWGTYTNSNVGGLWVFNCPIGTPDVGPLGLWPSYLPKDYPYGSPPYETTGFTSGYHDACIVRNPRGTVQFMDWDQAGSPSGCGGPCGLQSQ